MLGVPYKRMVHLPAQTAKKASNHYNFGLTLNAGYKGLNFNCIISGGFGGWAEMDGRDKLNSSIARNYYSLPEYWGNIYDPQLNPSGTNPNWSDISLSPVSNFWKVSSFRMRMTSFSINYSLPKRIVEPLKISNARVYVTGLNPFAFYNPYSYRAADKAYDQYPNLRTISFGLNLGL